MEIYMTFILSLERKIEKLAKTGKGADRSAATE